MHIPALATGLAGVRSITLHTTVPLPAAPAAINNTNTTTISNLSAGWSKAEAPGPVILPIPINTTTTEDADNETTTGHRTISWDTYQPPGGRRGRGGHGPVIIPTNTTKVAANVTTTTATTSPTVDWYRKFHPLGHPGGHGPVIIPADKLDDILISINTTTTTRDADEPTTSTIVIIPEDELDDITDINTTTSSSYIWLSPPDEDEVKAITRRASTQERRHRLLVSKRDGPGDPLPPRDRTLADHMENHGSKLPECYKKCMRQCDGRDSIHMGKDSLGKICGGKWTRFAWWSEHALYGCVNGDGGCPNKQDHRAAYDWLKWTCGDKPR